VLRPQPVRLFKSMNIIFSVYFFIYIIYLCKLKNLLSVGCVETSARLFKFMHIFVILFVYLFIYLFIYIICQYMYIIMHVENWKNLLSVGCVETSAQLFKSMHIIVVFCLYICLFNHLNYLSIYVYLCKLKNLLSVGCVETSARLFKSMHKFVFLFVYLFVYLFVLFANLCIIMHKLKKPSFCRFCGNLSPDLQIHAHICFSVCKFVCFYLYYLSIYVYLCKLIKTFFL
jgi:hypothetical protein